MPENTSNLTGPRRPLAQVQLELLNAIDSLRSAGIPQHGISLPQIIVCGDQSSEKGLILEAISGVSFPIQSITCSRFPTELVLRTTPEMSVRASLLPHHTRSEEERASMTEFSQVSDDLRELPTLIENAKTAMGITKDGKSFSYDILRLQISRPDCPNLTIIDMPALTHSENQNQPDADVELVQQIVQDYMEQGRSIILAVVAGKIDYANQIVSQLASKVDPERNRTLTAAIRSSKLVSDSAEKETNVLPKSQQDGSGPDEHATTGSNFESATENRTPDGRDKMEIRLFDPENQNSFLRLGVKGFRRKVSKILFARMVLDLPDLIEDMKNKSGQHQRNLIKLDRPRATIDEQQACLFEGSQSLHKIVKAATSGSYDDSFFEDPLSSAGYQRRLRAAIQNLSADFAADLATEGECAQVESSETKSSSGSGSEEDFLDEIVNMMERSRGRELHGMVNPMTVSELFKRESSSWEYIASRYVTKAWHAAEAFLKDALNHVFDPCTSNKVWRVHVQPELTAVLDILKERTAALLKPHKDGHPITYSHNFTENLQNIRSRRQKADITRIIDSFWEETEDMSGGLKREHKADLIKELLTQQTQSSSSRSAASEVHDYLMAYHKVAMQRLIDNVAIEVIEVCLIEELPRIFDTMYVSSMKRDEVTSIVGESSEHLATRKRLEQQVKDLETGVQCCQRFLDTALQIAEAI